MLHFQSKSNKQSCHYIFDRSRRQALIPNKQHLFLEKVQWKKLLLYLSCFESRLEFMNFNTSERQKKKVAFFNVLSIKNNPVNLVWVKKWLFESSPILKLKVTFFPFEKWNLWTCSLRWNKWFFELRTWVWFRDTNKKVKFK